MIERLIQREVQEFVIAHEGDDEQKLLLKHKSILDLPASLVINQITGRRKSKIKLPLYYNQSGIIYPPGINLEQSSSEKAALFKASVLKQQLANKNTLVDLTGGFGVDSLFFSQFFKSVQYVEPNAELIEYAKHNHASLQATNIEYTNSTAEKFLKSFQKKVDCIFIDPSRRSASNQKVFRLSDCEPDVPRLLSEIFELSSDLLIKTSPLLDIQQGLKELDFVKHVWVVSVDNECKELLFLCEAGYRREAIISAINLNTTQTEEFTFRISEEKNSTAGFSNPLAYLYEPNASILKSGAFKLLAEKFYLLKLHPSTHLYTADSLIDNFPGRIFRIKHIGKPDAKSFSGLLPDLKANVITRNYPLSPEALKKKLKLKDGGEQYVLAFSGQQEKFVVLTDRLK
jgi:hypothetical protein